MLPTSAAQASTSSDRAGKVSERTIAICDRNAMASAVYFMLADALTVVVSKALEIVGLVLECRKSIVVSAGSRLVSW